MPKITPVDDHSRPLDPKSLEPKTIVQAKTIQQSGDFTLKDAQTGQNNTVEGKQEATPIAPEFEALAKKESAVRARERDLQTKEAAIKARDLEVEELKRFKSRFDDKSKLLDVLNEMGVTYDDLVQQAINQPNPEMKNIQTELQALKDAQAKQAEEYQNSTKAQREAAITQIRHDVKDLVDSDEAFETIKGTESYEDVVDEIVRTFDETGKLITSEQAAKKIEDKLFEEAMKIASLNKVKSKLTPQTLEVLKEAKEPKQQQQIKTLTNDITTTRKLTARERAILRFKGENF